MHIPETPCGVWNGLPKPTLIDRTETAIGQSHQAFVYCTLWRMLMLGRIERHAPSLRIFHDIRPGQLGFVFCNQIKTFPEMVPVPPERLVARKMQSCHGTEQSRHSSA